MRAELVGVSLSIEPGHACYIPLGHKGSASQGALDLDGLRIAVHEWGDEGDDPLFLVHGGFDFARTYSEFAPRLARAGWRVVAWDQRGHGDSDHAALYGWDADIRDALSVMASVTDQPAPVVGHSKGGAVMLQLCDGSPYRISRMVNIDGMPSKRRMPDVPDHDQSRMLANEVGGWLDFRHEASESIRKPGTLEQLAERRGRMNPRLSKEWLEYLVTVGARHDPDGWRWKLDPSMRFGGFGPWRPEWTATRLPGLGMPFLGVLGAGFDSIVNARANTLTFPPGTAKYVRAMLRELGRFTPIAYRLELEHQTVEISGMLIAVGNGSTYGGGMKVCPGADVRDGVAEILIVGELPKLAFLRLFPKVFSGAHVHHPVTRVLQSAAFTLHAPGQTAWADGEYIGPTPVRLQVEPLAVRIIGAP